MRLGNDVLVFDRNNRHVETHHLAGRSCIVAGGRNNVVAGDVAFLRLHEPATRGRLLDIQDRRIAVNACATSPRPFSQRLCQVGRLDVTVIRMHDSADKPVDVAHRPELKDFCRRQEADINANRLRRRCILVILVHAVLIHGKPNVADAREAYRLPGFFFEVAVQVHRVLVNLPDAVTHVE